MTHAHPHRWHNHQRSNQVNWHCCPPKDSAVRTGQPAAHKRIPACPAGPLSGSTRRRRRAAGNSHSEISPENTSRRPTRTWSVIICDLDIWGSDGVVWCECNGNWDDMSKFIALSARRAWSKPLPATGFGHHVFFAVGWSHREIILGCWIYRQAQPKCISTIWYHTYIYLYIWFYVYIYTMLYIVHMYVL